MSLRNFAAPVPAIADHWFNVPIQNIDITQLGPFSTTADGASCVSFSSGQIAFVKPRPGAENKLLVAREKICSDLGYVFGLPIAPAVVRVPQPPDWPHYSLLSLACFKAAKPWGAALQPHATQSALEALESLRVFWTWVADNDHDAHDNNLMHEVSGGNCHVAAIDHAYSLCHVYDPANPLAVPASRGYGTEALSGADIIRKRVSSALLADGMNQADKIVTRLHDILTKIEQTRILELLAARLDLLKPWAA